MEGMNRMPMMIGPQPFDFKSDDGNCATDWQIWIRSFEIFAKANKMEDKEVMRDWLLHYAGPKVQDIYFNLPSVGNVEPHRAGPWAEQYVAFDNDPYQEVVIKLQEYFAPKKNQSYERHVFRKMHQKTNERIDAFVMRLRIQATRCDFGEHLDENLKEQTTSGCKSQLLRRKVLERDCITLDGLVKMARIIEDVAEQQKAFNSETKDEISDNSLTSEVCQVDSEGKFNRFRKSNFKSNSNIECSRCGLKGHKASFEKCPAKGKECKKCGKKDHFARKCFTRESMKRKQVNNHRDTGKMARIEPDPETVRIIERSMSQRSDDDEDIFMVKASENSNKIWCKIGGVETPIVVDTGSKNNIIDRETWMELKAKNVQTITRQKSVETTFRAYDGNRIKMLGMFTAILRIGKKEIETKFFVADITGDSLLGLKTGEEIGVVKINHDMISKIDHEPVGPLSKIKNVLVEIPIKENVKAVQQPYRRVPVPLEKAVDQKIDELLQKDIIEKVNFSNWISPLVIVPKPEKPEEIRICVDMKRANQAVARENYPLPTIDDILPELDSATVFSKLDVRQAFHQV